MIKAGFFILFFVLCPICFSALAGSPPAEIVLASVEWANATNKDGTGLYWDIFRAVYEPVGIKTKFIIRSYKGSVSLVKKNQADAMVGIHPEKIQGALSSRYPFVKDYVLVLFKKNNLYQWNGQETLKNKKVGWIKGSSFDEYLEVPVIKRELAKRENILRRLDKNQIDFFMDTRNDVESVLNKGIIDVTHYTVETVLELERYLVFADNRKGKELKKIFDDRFPRLVESGELDRLFAKWNW
ncbi:transporter substrate-binding domain-containing protein [bacterium]|nr:transporter substrate-binding domain-containing protein [bacterium]